MKIQLNSRSRSVVCVIDTVLAKGLYMVRMIQKVFSFTCETKRHWALAVYQPLSWPLFGRTVM